MTSHTSLFTQSRVCKESVSQMLSVLQTNWFISLSTPLTKLLPDDQPVFLFCFCEVFVYKAKHCSAGGNATHALWDAMSADSETAKIKSFIYIYYFPFAKHKVSQTYSTKKLSLQGQGSISHTQRSYSIYIWLTTIYNTSFRGINTSGPLGHKTPQLMQTREF